MTLIKIGDYEINPDNLCFIEKLNDGLHLIFAGTDYSVFCPNDSGAYIDAQLFITKMRDNGRAESNASDMGNGLPDKTS